MNKKGRRKTAPMQVRVYESTHKQLIEESIKSGKSIARIIYEKLLL